MMPTIQITMTKSDARVITPEANISCSTSTSVVMRVTRRPTGITVEVAHRQLLHVGKNRHAQIRQTALRHQHGKIILGKNGDRFADQGGEKTQHDGLQAQEILARDVLIDADFHQIGLRQAEGLLQRQEQQAQVKKPFVRDDEIPETADQPEIVSFAEDFFLLRCFGHLDLFQLLAQALLLIKLGIDAAVAHQFVVVAALDDFAFVEHEYFVRLASPRKSGAK